MLEAGMLASAERKGSDAPLLKLTGSRDEIIHCIDTALAA